MKGHEHGPVLLDEGLRLMVDINAEVPTLLGYPKLHQDDRKWIKHILEHHRKNPEALERVLAQYCMNLRLAVAQSPDKEEESHE
ncbi:hypothetical protein Cali_4 [Mycobacterium phage Cali]|uniref:Uncharacterized protein n=3 Tax=Bixzunavirus TaxID=680114 RepID=A0A1J0M9K7_9CAUD|nr:gp4 [Mycobacterium phage Cali]YP_009597607.1 hypothetical protein FDH18_gp004 [Mycobacterium phage Lukilu]ACU41532.1 hypothetical protein LRRHOOD_4 [Mycobacterium phage LRRHood]ATN89968.1 hypothetical protein SEA_KOGUMA_4 [Mycobacterium phage Koguma]ATN91286.1 hypothetical protein SEA_PHOX_4 [Mycobacterium phage Phox]QAY12989.1 hypothetical protein SEA_BADAGARTUDE_4 [Mycobacterium phage BadAgartude]QKO02096.1 hypothetical protein SEA_RONAN_4 [Mycobacterium phage Ronan]WNT44608.1 hypotheti